MRPVDRASGCLVPSGWLFGLENLDSISTRDRTSSICRDEEANCSSNGRQSVLGDFPKKIIIILIHIAEYGSLFTVGPVYNIVSHELDDEREETKESNSSFDTGLF